MNSNITYTFSSPQPTRRQEPSTEQLYFFSSAPKDFDGFLRGIALVDGGVWAIDDRWSCKNTGDLCHLFGEI